MAFIIFNISLSHTPPFSRIFLIINNIRLLVYTHRSALILPHTHLVHPFRLKFDLTIRTHKSSLVITLLPSASGTRSHQICHPQKNRTGTSTLLRIEISLMVSLKLLCGCLLLAIIIEAPETMTFSIIQYRNRALSRLYTMLSRIQYRHRDRSCLSTTLSVSQ